MRRPTPAAAKAAAQNGRGAAMATTPRGNPPGRLTGSGPRICPPWTAAPNVPPRFTLRPEQLQDGTPIRGDLVVALDPSGRMYFGDLDMRWANYPAELYMLPIPNDQLRNRLDEFLTSNPGRNMAGEDVALTEMDDESERRLPKPAKKARETRALMLESLEAAWAKDAARLPRAREIYVARKSGGAAAAPLPKSPVTQAMAEAREKITTAQQAHRDQEYRRALVQQKHISKEHLPYFYGAPPTAVGRSGVPLLLPAGVADEKHVQLAQDWHAQRAAQPGDLALTLRDGKTLAVVELVARAPHPNWEDQMWEYRPATPEAAIAVIERVKAEGTSREAWYADQAMENMTRSTGRFGGPSMLQQAGEGAKKRGAQNWALLRRLAAAAKDAPVPAERVEREITIEYGPEPERPTAAEHNRRYMPLPDIDEWPEYEDFDWAGATTAAAPVAAPAPTPDTEPTMPAEVHAPHCGTRTCAGTAGVPEAHSQRRQDDEQGVARWRTPELVAAPGKSQAG